MDFAITATLASLVAVYLTGVLVCLIVNLTTAHDFQEFYDRNDRWETREDLLKLLTDMIVWVGTTYETEMRINITKDEFVRMSLDTLRELTYDALDDITAQIQTVSWQAAFQLKFFRKKV